MQPEPEFPIGMSEEVCDLVKLLGIDPGRSLGLDIRIRPDELITVNVEVIADEGFVKQLGALMVKAKAVSLDNPPADKPAVVLDGRELGEDLKCRGCDFRGWEVDMDFEGGLRCPRCGKNDFEAV